MILHGCVGVHIELRFAFIISIGSINRRLAGGSGGGAETRRTWQWLLLGLTAVQPWLSSVGGNNMVNDIPSRISGKLTTMKRSSRLRQRPKSVFAAVPGFAVLAVVVGTACTSTWWCPGGAAAITTAFDATFGFGHGHQRHRRPSCEPSGDPEYPCRISRPPNAFDGEIALYFSGDEDNLSVKIVVPGVTQRGSAGGGAGWAALGFSPNGKMAGPSEADVGFLGAGENLEGDLLK